ncbi:MAG: hypothetical protein ACJ8CR_31070 [Roseiflexaceae bacterium]
MGAQCLRWRASARRGGAGCYGASCAAHGRASATNGASERAIGRRDDYTCAGDAAARTAPSATCTIAVRYKSGPSRAQGLGAKKADAKGDVSWSGMVGTRTTPGAWPVTITCGGEVARTEVVVP